MAFEPSEPLGERPMSDDECKACTFITYSLLASLEELTRLDGPGHATITMIRDPENFTYLLDRGAGLLESSATSPARSITSTWPGRTMQQAWRYGVMMRILGLISEAIHGDFVRSKRDIFYQDPLLFGSQRAVDRCIDIIASTIGVGRAALHVSAAGKGLIGGSFTMVLKDETVMDVGMHPTEGLLIPRIDDIKEVCLTGIQWILLVEKEAVFRRLATAKYHQNSTAGKGILITGKGYPDLCTRAFLRLLSTGGNPNSSHGLTRPICMLVDGDPDGMNIMSIYKYGSIAHLHDNASLTVGNIEWLGLRTFEIACEAQPLDTGSSMPLSLRDRKKIIAMLTRSPVFRADGPEPKWRGELQRMLMTNSKAEIEILYESQRGIEAWLDEKLKEVL